MLEHGRPHFDRGHHWLWTKMALQAGPARAISASKAKPAFAAAPWGGGRNKMGPPYFYVYIFVPKAWPLEKFCGDLHLWCTCLWAYVFIRPTVLQMYLFWCAKWLILYFLHLARFCTPLEVVPGRRGWRPMRSHSSPNGRAGSGYREQGRRWGPIYVHFWFVVTSLVSLAWSSV